MHKRENLDAEVQSACAENAKSDIAVQAMGSNGSDGLETEAEFIDPYSD